eukprot:14463536-Ditylum_brightwellii.AAC.1
MDHIRKNKLFPLLVHISPISKIILSSEHIHHLTIRDNNPENTGQAKHLIPSLKDATAARQMLKIFSM